MKYILFFSLVLLSVTTKAQEVKMNDAGMLYAQEIITADSLSKDQLFTRIKEWCSLRFRSANDAVQMVDYETGKIISKGNFKIIHNLVTMFVEFALQFECKDGKARITFTDFVLYNPEPRAWRPRTEFEDLNMGREKIFKKTDIEIRATFADLKNYLRKKDINTSDW